LVLESTGKRLKESAQARDLVVGMLPTKPMLGRGRSRFLQGGNSRVV